MQLINIDTQTADKHCPLLLKVLHHVHTSPQFDAVFSQFNLFLTSILLSFKIHFNIIFSYITSTWISKEKLLKWQDEYQIQYHEQFTELLTSRHSTDVEELRRDLDTEKENVGAVVIDLQAPWSRIVVMWRLLQRGLRGLSAAVKWTDIVWVTFEWNVAHIGGRSESLGLLHTFLEADVWWLLYACRLFEYG